MLSSFDFSSGINVRRLKGIDRFVPFRRSSTSTSIFFLNLSHFLIFFFSFLLFFFSFLPNDIELQVLEGSKCRCVRPQLWKWLRLRLRRHLPGNRYPVSKIRPLKVEQSVGQNFFGHFLVDIDSVVSCHSFCTGLSLLSCFIFIFCCYIYFVIIFCFYYGT